MCLESKVVRTFANTGISNDLNLSSFWHVLSLASVIIVLSFELLDSASLFGLADYLQSLRTCIGAGMIDVAGHFIFTFERLASSVWTMTYEL